MEVFTINKQIMIIIKIIYFCIIVSFICITQYLLLLPWNLKLPWVVYHGGHKADTTMWKIYIYMYIPPSPSMNCQNNKKYLLFYRYMGHELAYNMKFSKPFTIAVW